MTTSTKLPGALVALTVAATGAGVAWYFLGPASLDGQAPIAPGAEGRKALSAGVAKLKQAMIDPRLRLPAAPTVGLSSWGSFYANLGAPADAVGSGDVVAQKYRWIAHLYGVDRFGADPWAGMTQGFDDGVTVGRKPRRVAYVPAPKKTAPAKRSRFAGRAR